MTTLTKEIQTQVDEWINNPNYSEQARKEIKSLLDQKNYQELTDRFYRNLDFGTGGLRGIIGAGTNRMNKYVIMKATQGLANYILSQKDHPSPSVAVACDSRLFSKEFAEETACVFAANNIKAYLYKDLRPVPFLSFAVRETNSIAGVSVTASHNPKEYNGYKVYWADGAQITPPHDKNIINQVNHITSLDQVKTTDLNSALQEGLIEYIDQDMDEAYFKTIRPLKVWDQYDTSLNIVYTPIHGSGNKPVRQALQKWGFTNVQVVKSQELPDSNFPTVDYPNPEDPKALDLAVKQARETGADLVIGTDPDCDRVAIAVNQNGNFTYFNGNEVGSLLAEYVIAGLHKQNRLPSNPMLVKTIVTSDLGAKVARAHQVESLDTLTGFKYIGELIKKYQDQKKTKNFVIGYEESYGYLVGTQARDKDGVVSAVMIAEMVAYYKSKGSNLVKELDRLSNQYGYHLEGLETVTHKGKEGAEKITLLMEALRKHPPKELAGLKPTKINDYQIQKSLTIDASCKISMESDIDLPKSNVLAFEFGPALKLTVRPSGTEPKIKHYFQCVTGSKEESQKLLENSKKDFNAYLEQLV